MYGLWLIMFKADQRVIENKSESNLLFRAFEIRSVEVKCI